MSAEEAATAETVEETAENTAEETTEEVTEEVTEEMAEEAKAIVSEAEVSEKKAKTAVNILAALIVVAIAVIAFLLGGKLLGTVGDTAQTTDATSDAVTDITADTSYVTDVTDTGAVPFDGAYDNYTTVYANGFDYRNVSLSEYITLGNYKGLTAEVTVTEDFTDEEFADMVNYFLLQYAELGDAVTDRPAEMNDTVVIDYAGTVDGVAFEGGTATEQTATIGLGQYITGFEEGIIGMSIGETRDVHVTFPENYGVESLNGKDAVFKITLRSITENILPEYNDEFVSTNFEFADVAEFEQSMRDARKEDALSEKYEVIMQLLTSTSEMIKYPDGAIEDYIYQQVSYDNYYASYYGMDIGSFISAYYGISLDAYEAQLETRAENMINQEFALYAVAKAEGLTVTDEEMATATAEYLAYYGYEDVATLCAEMGASEELLQNSLHFSLIYSKVMEFMIENTTFTVVQ
ncbi:MAG: trigger factor [Clostridia bacterium]|nr:trigger factor [Clostridia bacterium]